MRTVIVSDDIEVTPSSGNVFEDLGLPDAEERLKEARRDKQAEQLYYVLSGRRMI